MSYYIFDRPVTVAEVQAIRPTNLFSIDAEYVALFRIRNRYEEGYVAIYRVSRQLGIGFTATKEDENVLGIYISVETSKGLKEIMQFLETRLKSKIVEARVHQHVYTDSTNGSTQV